MRWIGILPVMAPLLLATGCGAGDAARQRGPSPAARDAQATIALAARPASAGEVLVRGDASPAQRGPYTLRGRYRARFEQVAPEDPGLDFSQQTAFVARLERGGDAIALFRGAARRGSAVIDVPAGHWRLVVDFGDYPFVIRLTPQKR
jgi:hypothetical protein